MTGPPDLLARIDRAIAELQAIRAEVAAAEPPAGVRFRSPDADDLADVNLIEISTAVERFNRPADSLRWMCRTQGCGVKRGGRWLVAPARIERWLNGK